MLKRETKDESERNNDRQRLTNTTRDRKPIEIGRQWQIKNYRFQSRNEGKKIIK